MKKSLSLVVAAAMTLTTASVAFADAAPATTELSAQQKFDALKALGIFSGYPDGSAGLDKEMTRAEFAKVLTLLSQLEPDAAAAKVYTDVPATHWAAGFIGASTEAKLLNGLGANKFGPSGKVTIEQIAKVADLVAGVEPIEGEVSGKVSAWAKGYVAAAVKAGLLPELPSYQTNATRELLVEVSYDLAADSLVTVASTKIVDATHIEVTFSDGGVVKKELTTPLVADAATKVSVDYNGKSYEVTVTLTALKATEAAQSGAKKVTVKFNQAVSAADQAALTYELKSGPTKYPVTAKFSDDKMSAVLSAVYLPAGDFTLTVKGSDAISLKVEAETAKKLDITATTLQKEAAQNYGVKLYNQFGEEMPNGAQVTAFNATSNATVVNGDLSNAKIGDSIIVTAIYPAAGLSATKTLKVINGSVATSIKLDQVQPLTGDTRIAVGKPGYVLPLTMVDANGQAVTLPKTTTAFTFNNNIANYAGLTFYVSDTAVVKNFTVDANGVVKFETGTAGTAYITVTNGATGASAQTSVVVNPNTALKTLAVGQPASVVVQGEPVVLPYTAADIYGEAIAPKDLVLDAKDHAVTFTAFGEAADIVKNAKGELVYTPSKTGTTTLYVYVGGVLQANPITITVNAPKYFTAVSSIHDAATTYEKNASNEFDIDNIKLLDNYGRESDASGTVTITSDNTDIVTTTGGKLTAVAPGTATITVHSNILVDATHNNNNKIQDYTFTVTVVASSDIKSYAIDTVGTLYGNATKANVVNATNGHQKAITLVGKTAGGTSVALFSKIPTFVTSDNESVLKVDTDGKTVYGVKAGTSNVSAYYNGVKVAEQAVTVSEDAPTVKTVEFSADEYTINKDATVVAPVTVKDQYGVVLTGTIGQILVADTSVVDPTTLKGLKKGSTTITYVASNNTQDTATVVVNTP